LINRLKVHIFAFYCDGLNSRCFQVLGWERLCWCDVVVVRFCAAAALGWTQHVVRRALWCTCWWDATLSLHITRASHEFTCRSA